MHCSRGRRCLLLLIHGLALHVSSAVDATKCGHTELLVRELLLKQVRPLFQSQTGLFLQGRIAGEEVNVGSVVHPCGLPRYQSIRKA